MNKRKRSYRMKQILLIVMSLIVFCAGAFFTYYFSTQQRSVLVNNYIYQQQESVNRVVRHLKEALDNEKPETVDRLFSGYLQEEKNNNDDYWFLYTKENVIFERDSMQSALLVSKSLEELQTEWITNGKFTSEQAEQLFQGELSTAVFSKDSTKEQEVVSVRGLDYNNRTYYVGNACKESFILQLHGFHQNIFLFYLVMAVIAIIYLYMCIVIYKKLSNIHKHEVRLDEISHEHSGEIQRLDQELKERRKQVKNYQLLDTFSLFYNREYFYTLLLNMTRQELKSIGMIIVQIESLHNYINTFGLEYEQDILGKIALTIESSVREENVIARVQPSRIVITILNDDDRQMSEECAILDQNIKDLQFPFQVVVYSVIQSQQESAMEMYRRIDKIINVI